MIFKKHITSASKTFALALWDFQKRRYASLLKAPYANRYVYKYK